MEEFDKLGIEIAEIRLGEVVLKEKSSKVIEKDMIQDMLLKNGFELLYDRNQKIVDQIKQAVENGIQLQQNEGEGIKFSEWISAQLQRDYSSLSALFSSAEGSTLEKYIISRKIELVKDNLTNTSKTLSEIAYMLGYSSPAHLSNQLKKHTGHTSSHYRRKRQEAKILQDNSKIT